MSEGVAFGRETAPQGVNIAREFTTLARWIRKTRATEVHVRRLQREIRLPGMRTAEAIHAACRVLMEAGWLLPPPGGGFQQRARAAYAVNPNVFEATP